MGETGARYSAPPQIPSNVTVPAATDDFSQGDLLDLLCPPSLAEKFRRFHEDNPHVYTALVTLAREWKSRTGGRVGIAALFEVARWHMALETTSTPKLNNSYRSFYARLIMASEPDLADVFEVRKSAADEAVAA
ncbi:MAG TPA: hypothetical protein VF082_12780 [Jiangellaceae bacterium]